jgi:hypothetical protein
MRTTQECANNLTLAYKAGKNSLNSLVRVWTEYPVLSTTSTSECRKNPAELRGILDAYDTLEMQIQNNSKAFSDSITDLFLNVSITSFLYDCPSAYSRQKNLIESVCDSFESNIVDTFQSSCDMVYQEISTNAAKRLDYFNQIVNNFPVIVNPDYLQTVSTFHHFQSNCC